MNNTNITELILFHMSEGVLAVDLNGTQTFANPAATRILGYTLEEFIGKMSHSMWHHTKSDGQPYPIEECQIYAAYRDGKIHRSSDEVFWHKNGMAIPVEFASMPIYENGVLTGAVVTFVDITERKQAESELQDALDKIKTLRGILPICAHCKNIRDQDGNWEVVEVYVKNHTNVQFSHGICPECLKKFFPAKFSGGG